MTSHVDVPSFKRKSKPLAATSTNFASESERYSQFKSRVVKDQQKQTIDSIYYSSAICKEKDSSLQSSHIAHSKHDENTMNSFRPQLSFPNKKTEQQYTKYVQQIRKKVGMIEEEADNIIVAKEKQNSSLKLQIAQLKVKLSQYNELLASKNRDFQQCYSSMQAELSRKSQYLPTLRKMQVQLEAMKIALKQAQIDNEKLYSSLNQEILAHQTTAKKLNVLQSELERRDYERRVEESRNSNHSLKKEVEDLRRQYQQLKLSIQNCPGCYVLNQQKQRLAYSCEFMQKQLIELKRIHSGKQASWLDELKYITLENQQIKRETRGQLIAKSMQNQYQTGMHYKSALRHKSLSKITRDSIVKRCKTLTDSFL